jgi:hypothetical protein
MKTTHLLLAAVITASPAILPAQDLPNLVPVPSTPSVPPRSDKIQVNPSEAVVKPNITPAAGEKLQQLGSQLADATTSMQARDALVQIVNAATTQNGFVDLVGHLARQDRDRLGDVRRENLDELHKTIAQFREDFRAKYHQEFSLRPEHLKDATVNMGADRNALTVTLSELEKHPAVSPTGDDRISSPAKPAGDLNKNVAAQTGLGMVSGPVLNLINEGGAGGSSAASQWKVNIPNEISAKQLRENLSLHLKKLDDQKSTWSDDANVTIRAAAAQVLRSLNDATLASDQ